MDAFARDFLVVFAAHASQTFAWCVLPNHYHALVEAPDIVGLLRQLGLLHGRTSHAWNGEEKARGRKVFFRAVERAMRSERHYWATLNYMHHNPGHHGYVARWTDWPWSSAPEYLAQTDPDEAKRIWREYPLGDYGKGWDDPKMCVRSSAFTRPGPAEAGSPTLPPSIDPANFPHALRPSVFG